MGGNGPGEIRVCTRSTCCRRCVPPSVQCQLSTGKQIPKKNGNDSDLKPAKGRPTDTVKSKAFLKKTEVLVGNDKEQFTMSVLVRTMQECLKGTGETPVQCCINERIITVNNRNDVTFRSTVATIISKFYKQPKVDDYEVANN